MEILNCNIFSTVALQVWMIRHFSSKYNKALDQHMKNILQQHSSISGRLSSPEVHSY